MQFKDYQNLVSSFVLCIHINSGFSYSGKFGRSMHALRVTPYFLLGLLARYAVDQQSTSCVLGVWLRDHL